MLTSLALLGMFASGDALAGGVQVLATAGVQTRLAGRPRIEFVADMSMLTAVGWGMGPEGRVFGRFAYGPATGVSFTPGVALGGIATFEGSGTYIPAGGARFEVGRRLRKGPDATWLGVGVTASPFGDLRLGGLVGSRFVADPTAATPGLPEEIPGKSDAGALLSVSGAFPLLPVWIEGRPVRDGDTIVRARGACTGHGGAKHLQDGLEEHAAVLAFRRLAVELHAVGAPRALVGRVLRAAREEEIHAALCFGLAARQGAGDIVVLPMRAAVRGGDRRTRLARLAAESLLDGVINEGEAAKRAERHASETRDPAVADAKARIAREEAGHAVLARDIARWCARAA